MLDVRNLVNDLPTIEASLKKRNAHKALALLPEVVGLDSERRKLIQEVEVLKQRRNEASEQIGKLKREKKDDPKLMEEMKAVATQIKEMDLKLAEVEEKTKTVMYEFPNILHESVPGGTDASGNVEVRAWGTKPTFSFAPKFHYEIGEKLGIIDFKKAGEVTGARFAFLRGIAAKLERALIQLMLDTHGEAGYEEMVPPFLVNRDSLFGTGQLPKFEEDVFRVEKFDFFLIPTAEVPVTNYHRGEILDEKTLPKKYTAYTPCFRSEAGSYGKDTKGLKRQHQFNKVEMVKFAKPETSFDELEKLTADAEKVLQLLGLPYRVMLLCGGDIGFGSAKTYDIEVWSPPLNGYMEISSCSCFGDFQARRAGIRYRDDKGKVQFVHTLNGSGLAVGRTLLAIMENYQQADGSFAIPEVLKKYL